MKLIILAAAIAGAGAALTYQVPVHTNVQASPHLPASTPPAMMRSDGVHCLALQWSDGVQAWYPVACDDPRAVNGVQQP